MLNENKAYYWLSLGGVGAKRLNAVLSVYSALEIWERLPHDKKLQEALEPQAAELLRLRNESYLDGELDKIKAKNIRVLTFASDDYPQALRQREVSPPIVLYYKGDISALNKPCIAIVGTRQATRYGKEIAENFAREFALAGATVVSGLATGIDTFAHSAAADCGTTVAVLGGGFDYISPYSSDLADKIIHNKGAILTEYRPDFFPTKYSFPERNRIISGLSQGVVVIEAGDKSGALITADYALEQGREVYAVPGNINAIKSVGSNRLIRDGNAAFVTSAAQILSDLRLKSPESATKSVYISLDIYEQKIYNLLENGKIHFDVLLENSGFKAHELSALLFSMELKGLVKKLEGNNYALNKEHY